MSTVTNLRILCYVATFTLVLTFVQPSAAKLNLSKTALIIVDVQNDFCAGGSMAIPQGDDVIPVINQLRSQLEFGTVVFTKDWHPASHISFFDRFNNKSLHPNAKLRQEYTFDLEDGLGQRSQILWPTHCVQNSSGAELRIGLTQKESDIIVFKGTNPEIDSYSGFVDNDGSSETEMDAMLKERGVEELIVTGLALEYCVGNTARDGVMKGYKVTIPEDAVGCFTPAQKQETLAKLRQSGIIVRSTTEILNSEEETEVASNCPSCSCPMCTCTKATTESARTETSTEPEINMDIMDMTVSFNDCQCYSCTCPLCK